MTCYFSCTGSIHKIVINKNKRMKRKKKQGNINNEFIITKRATNIIEWEIGHKKTINKTEIQSNFVTNNLQYRQYMDNL